VNNPLHTVPRWRPAPPGPGSLYATAPALVRRRSRGLGVKQNLPEPFGFCPPGHAVPVHRTEFGSRRV